MVRQCIGRYFTVPSAGNSDWRSHPWSAVDCVKKWAWEDTGNGMYDRGRPIEVQ